MTHISLFIGMFICTSFVHLHDELSCHVKMESKQKLNSLREMLSITISVYGVEICCLVRC